MVRAHGLGNGRSCPTRGRSLQSACWQWRGFTRFGDGQSRQADGRNLQSACGGRQPPMARTHGPGGRSVQVSRWVRPKKCHRGMAAPDGSGPVAVGTGNRAQPAVAAYRALAGDTRSQWRGLTGRKDGE